MKNVINNSNYFNIFSSPTHLIKEIFKKLKCEDLRFIAFALTLDHLYSIESFLCKNVKKKSKGLIIIVDHDFNGTRIEKDNFEYASKLFDLEVFSIKNINIENHDIISEEIKKTEKFIKNFISVNNNESKIKKDLYILNPLFKPNFVKFLFLSEFLSSKYNVTFTITDEGYFVHTLNSFAEHVKEVQKKLKPKFYSITDFFRNISMIFNTPFVKPKTIIYSNWRKSKSYILPDETYGNDFKHIHYGHAMENKKLNKSNSEESNVFILHSFLLDSDKVAKNIIEKLSLLIKKFEKKYDNVFIKLHPSDKIDLSLHGISKKNIFDNNIPAEEVFALYKPSLIIGGNSLSTFKAKSMYDCEMIGFKSSSIIKNEISFEKLCDKYYSSFNKLFDDLISEKPLLSIVLLTYNALDYTKKCIDSILKNTKSKFEIIFVDNSSTDGTVDFLKKFINNSNHKLILNNINYGFSKGNNIGVKNANGKYVMLLNNDTILPMGWERALIESIERDDKIGAVGPLSNSISGRQMIKVEYKEDSDFEDYSLSHRQKFKNMLTPRRRLAGFAILIRKSTYKKINGFSEDYEIGNFEDDDLSLKIRKLNLSLMVDESVLIHHYGSQSFIENNIDYNSTMSKGYKIFKKNWPNIDYEELLEIKNPLPEWEKYALESAFNIYKNNDLNRSLILVNRILAINPISADTIFLKSLILFDLNKNKRSLKLLDKLLFLGHLESNVYSQKGIIFLSDNDFQSAILSFQRAIDLDPSSINNYKLRSEALLALNDKESAIDSLTETLNIFPEDLDNKERLFTLTQNIGKVS